MFFFLRSGVFFIDSALWPHINRKFSKSSNETTERFFFVFSFLFWEVGFFPIRRARKKTPINQKNDCFSTQIYYYYFCLIPRRNKFRIACIRNSKNAINKLCMVFKHIAIWWLNVKNDYLNFIKHQFGHIKNNVECKRGNCFEISHSCQSESQEIDENPSF
jgi:hypothetical protein